MGIQKLAREVSPYVNLKRSWIDNVYEKIYVYFMEEYYRGEYLDFIERDKKHKKDISDQFGLKNEKEYYGWELARNVGISLRSKEGETIETAIQEAFIEGREWIYHHNDIEIADDAYLPLLNNAVKTGEYLNEITVEEGKVKVKERPLDNWAKKIGNTKNKRGRGGGEEVSMDKYLYERWRRWS